MFTFITFRQCSLSPIFSQTQSATSWTCFRHHLQSTFLTQLHPLQRASLRQWSVQYPHLYIIMRPLAILLVQARNACLTCHWLIWILSFSVDKQIIRFGRRSWLCLQCMLYSRSSNMRPSTLRDTTRLRFLKQEASTHQPAGQYGLTNCLQPRATELKFLTPPKSIFLKR